jgi:hypothetical protein
MIGYDPQAILKLLGKEDEFYRISSGNLMVRCPFPHGVKPDGTPEYGDGTTLGIALDTGKWQCFSRCESKGMAIADLFTRLGIEYPTLFRSNISDKYEPKVVPIKPWMRQALSAYKDSAIKYWESRKITREVIEYYGLGNDLSGKVMHVPIDNYRKEFVGWASRVGLRDIKWLMQPDGVDKATLLFGAKMYDSDFAFGFESIPDVLFANSLGFNAFSTNGVHVFREMVEAALIHYNTICLVPHADEGGLKWAKQCVTLFRGRCKLTGTFPVQPYKDFQEMPAELVPKLFEAQKIISF